MIQQKPQKGVPLPAPIEFAGEWVAWNKERSRIIAHGKNVADVRKAAIAAGYPDNILQRVRRPDSSFISAQVACATPIAGNRRHLSTRGERPV